MIALRKIFTLSKIGITSKANENKNRNQEDSFYLRECEPLANPQRLTAAVRLLAQGEAGKNKCINWMEN